MKEDEEDEATGAYRLVRIIEVMGPQGFAITRFIIIVACKRWAGASSLARQADKGTLQRDERTICFNLGLYPGLLPGWKLTYYLPKYVYLSIVCDIIIGSGMGGNSSDC